MLVDVLQVGATIFAGAGWLYLAAMEMSNVLCAITNAEYGQLAVVFLKIKSRWIFLPYRMGTTRKDNAFYSFVWFGKMIEWVDLAVNVELPDTARYELGKLRAKVKNEDFFLHGQR